MKKIPKNDPPYFYVVEWFLETRRASMVLVSPAWRYRVITKSGIRSWAMGVPAEKFCWKTKAGAEKHRVGRVGPTQVVLRGQKVKPNDETRQTMLNRERAYVFEQLQSLRNEVASLSSKLDDIGRALNQ